MLLLGVGGGVGKYVRVGIPVTVVEIVLGDGQGTTNTAGSRRTAVYFEAQPAGSDVPVIAFFHHRSGFQIQIDRLRSRGHQLLGKTADIIRVVLFNGVVTASATGRQSQGGQHNGRGSGIEKIHGYLLPIVFWWSGIIRQRKPLARRRETALQPV